MSEIPAHSWFFGGDRVSIYEDRTVEIQHDGVAFRATMERWVEAATWLRMMADVCQPPSTGDGPKTEGTR